MTKNSPRNLVVTSILGVVIVGIGLAGWITALNYQQKLYHSEHTLIQCNGDYVNYYGNKDAARAWIKVSCPTDYTIVPNQNYKPRP